jgi:hypothetical protein
MDGKSEAANEAWSPVSSVKMDKQFQGISKIRPDGFSAYGPKGQCRKI